MDQDTLDKILEKVLEAIPDESTCPTLHIQIDLGSLRSIDLTNSGRIIGFTDKPYGLVIHYSADPRNLHDRAIYNRLQERQVFRNFEAKRFGYEGHTYSRHVGLDRAIIRSEITNILSNLEGLVSADKIEVRVFRRPPSKDAGEQEDNWLDGQQRSK